MRFAVVFARAMMAIILGWREAAKPFLNIFDQTGLEVVHVHRGGDVHRANQAKALFYPGFAHHRLDLRCNAHELLAPLGVEPKVFGGGFHGS